MEKFFRTQYGSDKSKNCNRENAKTVQIYVFVFCKRRSLLFEDRFVPLLSELIKKAPKTFSLTLRVPCYMLEGTENVRNSFGRCVTVSS